MTRMGEVDRPCHFHPAEQNDHVLLDHDKPSRKSTKIILSRHLVASALYTLLKVQAQLDA